MRRLTSEADLQAAREAFHRVFRSGDPFTAPFQPWVQGRAIIYPVLYYLKPDKYEPVATAAQRLGETLAYVSVTETHRGEGDKWDDFQHWEVELDPYPYHTLTQDWDWVPIMGQALYSVNGTWGVLTSPAVLGGPPAFMQVLEAHFNLEEQIRECIDYYADEHRRRRRNIDWFVDLVQHVYGPEKGRRLLAEAGLIH
ncbi:hypothetical protein [Sphaerobacter sp.]|uniref:hypothetical protein n=1 Tax=Sphaerobacter sp. TaxID=2099654 RepID=UPI001D322819|nr:hypothetical protein [Sphaerobacter sp.]MBX5446047.1 hypothetical protein [Sphaerobacter sp.]